MAENIYRKPVFLNAVNHRNLKVAPLRDFKFAKEANSALVVGEDFQEASRFYPIVFGKDQDSAIVAVALLSLKTNDNLFVDEEGRWREATYVPAYFRRYPFILAKGRPEAKQLTVCIDSAYEGFGKERGVQLFDGEGNQTEELKKTVELLTAFQAQFDRTRVMIGLLEEYGLLKEMTANITLPGGAKVGIPGLLIVDEAALLKLDDDKILKLVRPGYLALIYAHLWSLSNLKSLMALADKREKTGV